ncbi:MAG: hypothetical protein Q9160_005354 [Pyrenula sp. 1 TL-2023]
MATIDPSDTYTHLPLHLDATSKILSAPPSLLSASSSSISDHTTTLQDSLDYINLLHKDTKSLDTPNQIPPPPLPVNPKRSAQINKLRDAASAAHRKAQYPEAIKLYGYAIDMAGQRPRWEPQGLVREELSVLYANRAQSYMSLREWVEGWKDAECSVECKRGPGNVKGWWRGGRCLAEMGRWEECREWVAKGVEVEGRDGDGGKELLSLLKEVERECEKGGKLGVGK